MANIQRMSWLIFLLCVLSDVSGLKTHVICKRENIQKFFHQLYNINLLVNDTEVAMVDEDAPKKTSKVTLPYTVYNVSGSLGENSAYLEAELELDCNVTETLECQMFGFSKDMNGSKYVVLQPNITFDAKIMSMNSNIHPELESYATGDTVHILCSADVGSVDESWSVHAGDELLNFITNSSLTRSACAYHTTASFQYTFNSAGRSHINCKYGQIEVGKFSFETVDMHETLSFHLLLSSMVLVYLPFVIMPSLWCSCSVCSKTYRNPDNNRFKCIRSLVSFLGFIIFIIWWICVYSQYNHSKEISGYVTYACIEGLFILGYAIYRFLFLYIEKEDNWYGEKRAYNSRVTTSHGAVMTPIICWLMMKVPNKLPFYHIEIAFWIVAVISTLTFAFVSHRREHDDWGKKSK